MSTTETSPGPSAASDTGSQLTAENQAADIEGATLVYRRFGNGRSGQAPLLCLQHFRGNLDFWDPILVDRIAGDREVILLANRGVGASTGVVPDNVTDMARDVLRFVDAIGLKEIDLLGFSLGGYIAQELALLRPRLVRRIVLAGTAPRGGPICTGGPTMSTATRARTRSTPNTPCTCSSPARRKVEPKA
jgi:pimeloyl-ACP methyl ester carboxylesterase